MLLNNKRGKKVKRKGDYFASGRGYKRSLGHSLLYMGGSKFLVQFRILKVI